MLKCFHQIKTILGKRYDNVFDIPFMISFWNKINAFTWILVYYRYDSPDIDVTYILKIDKFSKIGGKVFTAKDLMHLTPRWYHKHEEIFMNQILIFECFLEVSNMPKTL